MSWRIRVVARLGAKLVVALVALLVLAVAVGVALLVSAPPQFESSSNKRAVESALQ